MHLVGGGASSQWLSQICAIAAGMPGHQGLSVTACISASPLTVQQLSHSAFYHTFIQTSDRPLRAHAQNRYTFIGTGTCVHMHMHMDTHTQRIPRHAAPHTSSCSSLLSCSSSLTRDALMPVLEAGARAGAGPPCREAGEVLAAASSCLSCSTWHPPATVRHCFASEDHCRRASMMQPEQHAQSQSLSRDSQNFI